MCIEFFSVWRTNVNVWHVPHKIDKQSLLFFHEKWGPLGRLWNLACPNMTFAIFCQEMFCDPQNWRARDHFGTVATTSLFHLKDGRALVRNFWRTSWPTAAFQDFQLISCGLLDHQASHKWLWGTRLQFGRGDGSANSETSLVCVTCLDWALSWATFPRIWIPLCLVFWLENKYLTRKTPCLWP